MNSRGYSAHALAMLLLVEGAFSPFGAGVSAAEIEFNRDIRPILAENCFACHGADSVARKAGLRLDRREAAIESGAIVPGKTDDSDLVVRILSEDPKAVMPPPQSKKKLTDQQKALLTRWVASGAEYQPLWSFLPPKKPTVPVVGQAAWPKNAIDHFVLSKLEQKKLAPAPKADARTLFRRLHLDITGLPPAPEAVAAFVRDFENGEDAALSDWIDRLMGSPAWGEHRARYWLDAARYGDTHGLHFDNYREMWPYRDWVIRAFNANMHFDEFTTVQLAGDLLPNPTDDQLIATGFQRCNITTNEGGSIEAEILASYAADRVQTFGWVYLGLTTNCAQCHDHKFDPFTTRDYYSLAAFFRNTTQPGFDGNLKEGRGPILVVPSLADRPRWDALPEEIAAATSGREKRKTLARGEFATWLATTTPETIAPDVAIEGIDIHVPLNEGTGNEVAASGKAPQTLLATGPIEWSADGKIGPAPVLKVGSTFDLGQQGDFEKDQSFSFGAWVKTAGDAANASILARADTQAANRGWELRQNGRTFSAQFVDDSLDNAIKASTRRNVVKPGRWQHVLVTFDASNRRRGVRIFVDGKDEALNFDQNNLKAEASIRTSTSLRIGQRSTGSVFDGGAVQDVRVYSRKLSPEEVQAIAENGTIRAILAIAAEKRTPRQQDDLYEYYLEKYDADYRALNKTVADLEAERETIRARSPLTHIQEEKKGSTAMARILMRGAYDQPAEQVEAATPAALHPLAEGAPKNRLGLAQWVVDPANPLTARVTVNRFWQEVFGRAIVATAEDFGTVGTPPTHPELLDWLAVDFRESGWDVKRFFKQMLMSATYRQSAAVTPQKVEQDLDNALLSRGPRFRMDAEMVRDYSLAASGLLSPKMYGPGVKPYQPDRIWSIVGLGNTKNYTQDKGEDLYRRTVYSFWKRMAPPPNLEAFNSPSREFCVVRRERTNTPLQALVTLNDPQFVEAARHLAARALASSTGNDERVLEEIARYALGRSLNARERETVLKDKDHYAAYYRSKPDDAKAFLAVGKSEFDQTLDLPELAAWTMISNELLNLDETLNK